MGQSMPVAIMIGALVALLVHSNVVLLTSTRGLSRSVSRTSSILVKLLCVASIVAGTLMYFSVMPGEQATSLAFTFAGVLVALVEDTYSRVLGARTSA